MNKKQPVIRIEKFDHQTITTKGVRKRFYFRGVAENGEIIFASESYTTKAKRDRTVRLFHGATFDVTEGK